MDTTSRTACIAQPDPAYQARFICTASGCGPVATEAAISGPKLMIPGYPQPNPLPCDLVVSFSPENPDQAQIAFPGGECVAGAELAIAAVLTGLIRALQTPIPR